MSTLLTVPLCQLKPSKSNVRKTDRMADVESLAASIEANGLLENLVVRPTVNGRPGSYEVIAGGRRFSALKLLAKRKKLDAQHPVACLALSQEEANVSEVSLAENFARVPLHPADQFDAFAMLSRDLPADDIAARFGVTPVFVAQRLKLASVSPRLVAEYRVGHMTLEQLTAFTLSDDHRAQETVWFDSRYAHVSPADIRSLLTKSQVEADDRRARFVGLEAYEAAGGQVVRDLFDAEKEGYLADSRLLDRLVAEKLEAAAEPLRSEGWLWVEVHAETDMARLSRFDRADKAFITLSSEDEARLTDLCARYDELVTELEETESESASAELDRVSAEIAELQNKKEVWTVEAKSGSGVIVSLDWHGELHISRGLVRPQDNPSAEQTKGAASKPGPVAKTGYGDSVLLDLSAHRTAVLRTVMSQTPHLVLAALVHAFAEQLFYRGAATSCLSIAASEVHLDRASETVASSRASTEFASRHAAWQERMPEHETLWQWTLGLRQEEQLVLLAHCAALTVNALEMAGRPARDWPAVAEAATIDMRDWWQPTAGFLTRLTKSEILAAVSEGVSSKDARHLEGNKKDRMVESAERLLQSTRWLPVSLRASPAVSMQQT